MSIFKTLMRTKQDAVSAGKVNAVPLRAVKATNTSSSPVAAENVERLRVDESAIVDRIGKLDSLLKTREAMFVEETEHAERLIHDLKSDLAVLQTKLKQTQEAIATRDLSHQERENTLTAEIKKLQSDIKAKDETLALRDEQIKDGLKQIETLQLVIHKMEQEAYEAESVAEGVENLQAKIHTLESQLEQTEKLAQERERGTEELAAELKEFEGIAKQKEKLLTARQAEISDLKKQLKELTTGIAGMSSFVQQAARLSRIVEERDAGKDAQNDRVVVRQMAGTSNIAQDPSILPEMAEETVPPEILESITSEVANVTNVMVNLASLLVRRHAKSLGESIEKFPTKRLPELFEALATELSDEKRQVDFRWRLAQAAHIDLY